MALCFSFIADGRGGRFDAIRAEVEAEFADQRDSIPEVGRRARKGMAGG
jgi:hypothetical protein